MNDKKSIEKFQDYLRQEEKSKVTIEKYQRDVLSFGRYLKENHLNKFNKEIVVEYKEYLKEKYQVSSVNSILTALNRYLRFIGKEHCCVKLLKVQKQIFAEEEKELNKSEYQRLVKSAKNTRLFFILQTICGTGIRISELQYITVEAVKAGKAVVNCKNKTRVIFIPESLQKILKEYIKKTGLKAGSVFVSRTGKPLNRSNIWREMKALCKKAGVEEKKVFPHNLRHLFARTFYSVEKDIVRLADLLGHSSINTTRIYTIESGSQHRSYLERIQKILTT